MILIEEIKHRINQIIYESIKRKYFNISLTSIIYDIHLHSDFWLRRKSFDKYFSFRR
jgi:hypothetical protein